MREVSFIGGARIKRGPVCCVRSCGWRWGCTVPLGVPFLPSSKVPHAMLLIAIFARRSPTRTSACCGVETHPRSMPIKGDYKVTMWGKPRLLQIRKIDSSCWEVWRQLGSRGINKSEKHWGIRSRTCAGPLGEIRLRKTNEIRSSDRAT